MKYPIRINKYLRDNNLASRREADRLIKDGLVLVNDKLVEMGYLVKEKDKVVLISNNKTYQYFAYYKPKGLPTQDLPGMKSVITEWQNKGIYPIGRLDKESEGLLLLTNDGRFTREVLSKKKSYEKEYIVTVREELKSEVIDVFKEGMRTKTFGKLLPVKTKIVDKKTIKMILREGKRHQIRVMLSELSYTVTSLKRIRIGDINLQSLKPGDARTIKVDF